jgi:hypothetical protein
MIGELLGFGSLKNSALHFSISSAFMVGFSLTANWRESYFGVSVIDIGVVCIGTV